VTSISRDKLHYGKRVIRSISTEQTCRCLQPSHTFMFFGAPASQHFGHSQLLGRSSLMTPSCVSCGYVSCRHDRWTMFQHTLHSISWLWASSVGTIVSAAESASVLNESPLLQRTHSAAVGSIGCKCSQQHHINNCTHYCHQHIRAFLTRNRVVSIHILLNLL